MNVIRQVADYRAMDTSTFPDGDPLTSKAGEGPRNGTNYLFTSLTLFTTHEPCVMCSMALVHSRLKELFYLVPMEKTGGCGGLTCLPELEGLNHRFTIYRWKEGEFSADGLAVDHAIDA
jgi:tRNA-specific adenosine deaminase 3